MGSNRRGCSFGDIEIASMNERRVAKFFVELGSNQSGELVQ